LIQKEKLEDDEKNLKNKNDFENQKKKFSIEMASLTSTISNLKAHNLSLENSLNAMKQTNKQTVDSQSEQFTSMHHRWENEKDELLKASQELIKLKNDIVELKKKNYQQFQMQKLICQKKYDNERCNNEELTKQINMLNTMIENNNSNNIKKRKKSK